MYKRRSIYSSLVLFFLLLLLSPGYASEEDNTRLQKLLLPFTETKHIKLAYEEKRFSLFLKQPQTYHGFIEYTRPNHFIKQVLSPDRKKFVIEQDQLTIYSEELSPDNDQQSKASKIIVSLDDYPQFKQFEALFSGLLQGNAEQLTQYYDYEIHSMPDGKTGLMLKTRISDPFTQEHQAISKQIEIIFHENFITKMTMTGFGSEKSELTFKHSDNGEQTKINPRSPIKVDEQ